MFLSRNTCFVSFFNFLGRFSLPGEKWKNLRTKLTPAFTSGKLKGMFPTIAGIGKEFIKICEPMADNQQEIEIRTIAGRYVADCLASIAFGLEGVSTLNDPTHEFLTTGKKLTDKPKVVDVIRRSAVFLCPKLVLKLHYSQGYSLYFSQTSEIHGAERFANLYTRILP